MHLQIYSGTHWSEMIFQWRCVVLIQLNDVLYLHAQIPLNAYVLYTWYRTFVKKWFKQETRAVAWIEDKGEGSQVVYLPTMHIMGVTLADGTEITVKWSTCHYMKLQVMIT